MGRVLVLWHPAVGSDLVRRIDGALYWVMPMVSAGHPVRVVTTLQGRLVAVSEAKLDFIGLHGLIDKYESEQEGVRYDTRNGGR